MYMSTTMAAILCLRNPRIACSMQRRSCFATLLEELKIKYKSGGEIEKFFGAIRDPYIYSSRPFQPFHIQPDLI
jgi:hypothetical protein